MRSLDGVCGTFWKKKIVSKVCILRGKVFNISAIHVLVYDHSLSKNLRMVGKWWSIRIACMIIINCSDCMKMKVVRFHISWKQPFGLGCQQYKEVRVWIYSSMCTCIPRSRRSNLWNGMNEHCEIRLRKNYRLISSHFRKYACQSQNLFGKSCVYYVKSILDILSFV